MTESNIDTSSGSFGNVDNRNVAWAFQTSLLNDFKMEPDQIFEADCRLFFLLSCMVETGKTKERLTPKFSLMPILSRDTAPDLPLPFASDHSIEHRQWDKWIQNNCSRLAKKTHICEDEWCGYLFHDPYLLTMSTMLEGIWFSMGHKTVSCDISSYGREGNQTFTLKGELSEIDARVTLVQDYTGSQIYHWHCSITPFGIVGYWSIRHSTELLGYVWLWKRTWV